MRNIENDPILAAILIWYKKGKVTNICYNSPRIPPDIIQDAKDKDMIRQDNLMRGRI